MNFNDFLWIFVVGVIAWALFPLVKRYLEFRYGGLGSKTEL
jgi:hypothetical protein